MSTQPFELTVPEKFGPYRILRPLGKGGMGTVFLAHDTRLDRQVALKICHVTDDPQSIQRLRREAKAAASLRHPNLCPVHEFDIRDGIAYLTMDYIEGATLSEWVSQRGGLSQREAAILVAKLALAMQEAHNVGVLHRDLKPTNIVINKQEEAVILDFGLARRLNVPGTRLTKLGAIVGTPAYMAPEQAGGDPETVGPAADVYALGVILYQLLTGRVPFEGPMFAILGQLLRTPPEPPSRHNAGVDGTLERICLKALAKKPEDRQRSMKEFAEALAKAARSLVSIPAPKRPKKADEGVFAFSSHRHIIRPQSSGRRSLWKTFASLASILLCVAGGLYAFHQWRSSTPTTSLRAEKNVAQHDPSKELPKPETKPDPLPDKSLPIRKEATDKARLYLLSQLDTNLHLVPEPGAKSYSLRPTNYLVAKVLATSHPSVVEDINTAMRVYQIDDRRERFAVLS